MQSSPMIVEVLAVGYTAFIWVALFIGALRPEILAATMAALPQMKDAWAPLALFSAVIAYQLGWLLSELSHWIFYYGLWIGRSIKRKHVKNRRFLEYYVSVCQSGSAILREDMNQDHAVIRFTRAGVLNFALISIGVLWVDRYPFSRSAVFAAGAFLVVAGLCLATLWQKWDHWYAKLEESYEQLHSATGPSSQPPPEPPPAVATSDSARQRKRRFAVG